MEALASLKDKNERPVPYLKQYDTPASHSLVFLENCKFSITSSHECKLDNITYPIKDDANQRQLVQR